MRCNDITQQMSEALDAQLDVTQQAAFDAHLAECPACRERFEALRETVEQLHGLEPLTPPPNLIVGINAAIDRPRGFGVSWNIFNSPPMRVALAASLMVVVGLLGIQYLNPTSSDTATAVREAPASCPADAPANAPVTVPQPLSAPAPVMAPPTFAAPRPAPGDGPAESVVMLEEAAAGEDNAEVPEEAESTMVPKKAEVMMGREVGDKRRQTSRALASGAMRKSVAAPAVTSTRMDRDEMVWAEPVPEGAEGGLRVGGEVRVVHISVTGLARDVVMQAAEEPVETQGAADRKKEKSRAASPGVAGKGIVEPKPDMMQDLVVDAVMQTADTSATRRETEEFKDESEAEYIVLHLSPARLDSFLARLRALDEDLTVSTLPIHGGAGELVEIQIQLLP